MRLQLRSKADDKAVAALKGQPGKEEHFPFLVRGNASVFKPDGARLLVVRRACLSEAACDAAYEVFHTLRNRMTDNRGRYGGQSRGYKTKHDGTMSRTSRSALVPSIIMGAINRYARIPYCRQTAFLSENPEAWGRCLPFIQEAAAIFAEVAPERYRAQKEAANETHPSYVIPETPFTTITVNNTFAGSYHQDAGDYAPGFGVMAVLRRGEYKGCHLGFPAYGIAADLQDRDLILFDPHEYHGNTPFYDTVGEPKDPAGHERISVVMYFREKMTECLSPEEEIERAKEQHTRLALVEE